MAADEIRPDLALPLLSNFARAFSTGKTVYNLEFGILPQFSL